MSGVSSSSASPSRWSSRAFAASGAPASALGTDASARSSMSSCRPFLRRTLVSSAVTGRWSKGKFHRAALVVPDRVFHLGEEEALLPLHVVLLQVRRAKAEAGRRDARAGPIRVVPEVLRGLHVVLVAIRPVEVDFLAVVGDDVGVLPRVAPLRDKVAVLVVAAKERVEVVVDVAADVAGRFRVAGPLSPQHVLLPVQASSWYLTSSPLGAIASPPKYSIIWSRTSSNFSARPASVSMAPWGHGLLDGGGELPVDVAVDDLPLVVHDAVDAEVQVGAVELEELAEEACWNRACSGGGETGSGSLPGRDGPHLMWKGVRTRVMGWGSGRCRPERSAVWVRWQSETWHGFWAMASAGAMSLGADRANRPRSASAAPRDGETRDTVAGSIPPPTGSGRVARHYECQDRRHAGQLADPADEDEVGDVQPRGRTHLAELGVGEEAGVVP